MAKRKQIYADDALEYGLNLEVAPTTQKEITADSQGRYVGQNGLTASDLNMVGTGQYMNNTDWNKMGPGYSMVVNPYDAASPEQVAQRQQGAQVSTGRNDLELMGDDAYNRILANQAGWSETDALYRQALAAGDNDLAAELLAKRDGYHDANEAIRAGYGYSGGADGSGYLGLMAYTGGLSDYDPDGSGGYGGYGNGGYAYDPYLSKYQARIDALADTILNRDPFSYDKEKDPLYQQYKTSYTRGGQRAMQDTLAQVSARTGGLASSYAQSASQQTYNNYMAALADKVPELQQLAYSMYMDDLNQDRADLGMLQGLEEYAYGLWRDDRDFDYGMYRDTVADNQWQQQFDYNAQQDALAQENWLKQFDYTAAQDALAQQNWQTQWDYGVQQDALDREWQQKEWDYKLQQDALAREDALASLLGDGDTPVGGLPTGDTPTGTGDGYTVDPETGIKHPDKIGGKPLDEYSDAAGNYKDVASMCEQLYASQGKDAVLSMLREAYQTGVLNLSDYSGLYSKYRNKEDKKPTGGSGGGGGGTNTHMAY